MNRPTEIAIIVGVVAVVVVAVVAAVLLLPSGGKTSPPQAPPGASSCAQSSGSQLAGNWTTYHQSNSRAGVEAVTTVSAVHQEWSGPVTLNGQLYAEPLVCGNTVYVATEADSVYAVNATTGSVLWQANLGTPMPGSSLPCGNIDPSGITGTPVIDTTTGTIYAVAFLTPGVHELFGLNVANGSVDSEVAVDPSGANPLVEQQRGALLLANGYVYVPYGGLYGDCGDYHGWVVGAPVSGTGGLVAYQVPTQREGGIWGTAGFGLASDGDLYVSTGNGASSTTFDHGDSVIELSPTLTELGYFAPSNWAQLNEQDTDLGSVAPTVLPDGNVFQIGKEGVGYLLSGTDLGGIGGEIANASVCGGAYGGTARVGASIFVPCLDGVFDVLAGAANLTVEWQTSNFDAGSPIVTGDIVWAVNIDNANLLGFNITNGDQVYSFPLAAADHFISPAAAPGSLFVGGGTDLYAYSLS